MATSLTIMTTCSVCQIMASCGFGYEKPDQLLDISLKMIIEGG